MSKDFGGLCTCQKAINHELTHARGCPGYNDGVKRANYLPVPHVFALDQACMVLAEAFDHGVYLVGSCLHKRDYRDVDVRAIVSDETYERMFPGVVIEQHHPLWSVMCASISLYLEKASGLPIDFQIQKQSDANAKYPGERHALGMFLVYRQHKTDPAPPEEGEGELPKLNATDCMYCDGEGCDVCLGKIPGQYPQK